ncbi:MAG: hypothetical protein ACI85I_000190 [Arenicella sp.]
MPINPKNSFKMIQRIQSIFLLIASVAAFSMIFLPVWVKVDEAAQTQVLLDTKKMTYIENGKEKSETNTIALSILAGLSSIVAMGSLFSYKNRMTQIKLNLLNSLLLAGTVGLMCYYYADATQLFNPEDQGKFGIGFFAPMLALICNSLSNRFIRKDEKLVKSVDRLR